MRNILLSCGLLFAFMGSAIAQDNFKINPKVGVNFYDISDASGDFDNDGKSGFHAGVDFRIGDKVFIQPGAHYYSLKSNFTNLGIVDQVIDELTDDVQLQTVRIPVMVGSSFLQNDKFGLRAQVGLVGLFPIGTSDNTIFDNDDYRNINFGAAAGLGMDIGIITLDLVYDFGLTDSFEDNANFNGKGNILSLSVGLAF